MWLAGESVRIFQWFSLLLATAGIAVIVLHTDGTTTFVGLILVLMAALSWAGGNITAKQGGPANMLSYVVWSSAFAVPPLLALSFAIEPWEAHGPPYAMPTRPHGPPWRGRGGGIRSSVMRHGAGCSRATPPRRSCPSRCSFRYSEWVPRRYGWANRCRHGSWLRQHS
ncbi:membrane hypothetical protein [Burkholderiales bacterium]|nr:membrane hypothetical protein [Burkholderiales bacterium]